MDRRLLLPWILMLVLDNWADGQITWGTRPSAVSITVDLNSGSPCQNSLHTFDVREAEDETFFRLVDQNPDGKFIISADKLYCNETAIRLNGYSSYNLNVSVGYTSAPGTILLTDTFTLTILGLPTTNSQTTTASTTQATAASTTQTSTASTTQVTAASTTQTTTLSTNSTVNPANRALTWVGPPPSQRSPSVDLNQTNPCQHSIYTFSVFNYTVDQLLYSITQNPDGKFIISEDRLYCTDATLLRNNGYSSYTLTVTITDGTTTLTDTFTVTIIGLPTTTAQTTTASTTSATAASTTQVTSSSKPACGNLSWDGPPPSQRFPSVNFSSTQPNPCKDSIYTFSVCGARDQLKISITQNPDGKFITSADRLYCTDATLLRNNGYSSYNLTVTITDGIQPPLVDTFTLGINSEAGGMIVSMVTLIGCLLISKLE